MKVALVRHAIAEDRDVFSASGEADELRPLTGRGRKKMIRVAAGLRTLLPQLDLLATSPLLRAVATGEILAAYYDGIPVLQIPQLAPGAAPGDCLQWIQAQRNVGTLALVGHQPDLAVLADYMLTGGTRAFLALKKGGVCLLEVDEAVEPGSATLQWALKPSQLAALGPAEP